MRHSVLNRERRVKALVPGLLVMCLYCGMASASLSQESVLSSAGSSGGPSILVTETRHEFGEVDEGAKVSHEFIVENKGRTDLTTTRVSPD
jgi:hypothetical protein